MYLKFWLKKFIPSFALKWYHLAWAFFSALFFNFPSKKIKVIGITGTKGKSTTVILAGKILEQAGFKIGWVNSATVKVDKKEWLNPFHMTMPGRFFLQKIIKEMVKKECEYCILEITSEGISQFRHKFIDFKTAVFTNLQPEHIEAHGSFENYRNEKLKLFNAVKNIHIVNIDDENANYFLQFPAKERYLYKVKSQESPKENLRFPTGQAKVKSVIQNSKILEAENVGAKENSVNFKCQGISFNLNLIGDFNVYNALAAICIGLSQGIDLKTCKIALEKIEYIPGRQEIVVKKPYLVIVDLAHTPDSFEAIFKLVQKLSHKKIISVFGSAGGGRDKWKRPVLGEIATKYCQEIIVTNEDPYDEDPRQILSMIRSGIFKAGFPKINFYEILDRREAIKKGLELAEQGDIVLVLGKGTEQTLVIGDKKIPWDDRKIIREEFEKLDFI